MHNGTCEVLGEGIAGGPGPALAVKPASLRSTGVAQQVRAVTCVVA